MYDNFRIVNIIYICLRACSFFDDALCFPR